MSKTMILMNLGIILATIVAFIYFTAKARIKEDKAYAMKQRRKLHNRFSRYYNSHILRGPFRRIVEMYASLSCYDSDTVKEEAVKLFEKNVAIVIILPIVGFIVMKDALMFILLGFMGYIYYQTVIEKENDFKTLLDNNEHVKLVKECISKNKFSSNLYFPFP